MDDYCDAWGCQTPPPPPSSSNRLNNAHRSISPQHSKPFAQYSSNSSSAAIHRIPAKSLQLPLSFSGGSRNNCWGTLSRTNVSNLTPSSSSLGFESHYGSNSELLVCQNVDIVSGRGDMSNTEKETTLKEMFPSLGAHTVSHSLQKCNGDTYRAADLLIDSAFFVEEDSKGNCGPTVAPKGVPKSTKLFEFERQLENAACHVQHKSQQDHAHYLPSEYHTALPHVSSATRQNSDEFEEVESGTTPIGRILLPFEDQSQSPSSSSSPLAVVDNGYYSDPGCPSPAMSQVSTARSLDSGYFSDRKTTRLEGSCESCKKRNKRCKHNRMLYHLGFSCSH